MVLYKSYNQESLDSQFNNRLHVPGYADYLNRWEKLSQEAGQKLPVIKDISYGKLPRERLDVYPSTQRLAKTLIFIHGGYWQMLDKSMFHFIANSFRSYGITTVLLTYPLAPDVSIDQIVLSCRNATRWLYLNLPDFNGDPNQLYVAGHSAGGHLAAMLLATNWSLFKPGVPADVLKGACFMSGLFNLVPVHLSYLNKVLQMQMETAIRNSPVQLEPVCTCPLIVAVGDAETAEFNDQSKELYSAWKDKAAAIQLLQLTGLNHYSILEDMVDPDADLHKSICQLMEV